MTHISAKEELPYGTNTHKLEGHRYGDVGVSFFLVGCPPGGGAVLHTHPYEEAFVTLEGEATFIVGEETIEVSAGRIVVAPAGCPTNSSTPGAGCLGRSTSIPAGASDKSVF